MRISKRLLAGVLLFAGACDPAAVNKAEAGDDKSPEAKADTAKTGEKADGAGPADSASPADDGAKPEDAEATPPEAETLDACLSQCEGADLSEDNLATCRLQCKNAHGAADSRNPTVGAYFACFDDCATKSEDNRATCEKNCAASVTAGGGDPAKSECPRGCVETLGGCLGPCEAKGADDKATCQKQCEVAATSCVEGCE